MGFFEIAFALAALAFLFEAVTRVGPSPPRRPAPPPAPHLPTDWREFRWRFSTGLASHDLACRIGFRPEAYESARDRLLDESPSKVQMGSDEDTFEVASEEVLDEDAGAPAPELAEVVDYLIGVANEKALSNYQLANLILSFVQEQCIPYSYDEDSTGHREYFRFPLETIVDQTVDCDCKAILGCALYSRANYRVAFALMPGHAAIAISSEETLPFANWVFNGTRWYYCEATGDCWQPGAIPPDVRTGSVALREIAG